MLVAAEDGLEPLGRAEDDVGPVGEEETSHGTRVADITGNDLEID